MRALLINPKRRTITEIDYDGTPEAIGKLIGCSVSRVASTLNGWLQEGSDTVWVSGDDPDDDKYPSQWFQIGIGTDRASDPIGGKGLVVGTDKAGENCPAIISHDELIRRVTFTKCKFRGFESTLVPEALNSHQGPIFAETVNHAGGKHESSVLAKFRPELPFDPGPVNKPLFGARNPTDVGDGPGAHSRQSHDEDKLATVFKSFPRTVQG